MLKNGRRLQLFILLSVIAFLLGAVHESSGAFRVIQSSPGRNTLYVSSAHNHIVRDSTGKLYVAYSLQWHNYIRWSSDNGKTWSEPVNTETLPDSISIQSLVVDTSDNLYQGFTFNVGSFFTKSTDGGVTWTPATQLHDGGWGAWDYWPSLIIDGSGTLHTVYFAAFGWGDWPANVIYKTSSDNGDTWSPGMDLTGIPNLDNYGLGAQHPNMYAGSGNNLFVLYSDYLTFTEPHLITKKLLHFNGTTWSSPLTVSSEDISMLTGDIAVDSSGLLHIIYHEKNSITQNYQILYRTYNPGTQDFSMPIALTPDSTNAYYSTMGIYSGDKVVIAYDTYDNQSQKHAGVFLKDSSDSFVSTKKVSVHPEARWPNLRSSKYVMNQPNEMDLIWIEPNNITGGEDLVLFVKDSPEIAVYPDTINFESVLLNESLLQTVTITNMGLTDLVVDSITVDGTSASMYSVSPGGATPCENLTPILTPDSSCTIQIIFTPTELGSQDAFLNINSNDNDMTPLQISLTGKGVMALFTPSEGTIGTVLTITGSDFGEKKGKVLIGGYPTKIGKNGWTDTAITCTVNKPLPEGPHIVEIRPLRKEVIILSDAFVMKNPEITDDPPSSSGFTGEEITLNGNFFGPKKGKVYFEYEQAGTIKNKSCKVKEWSMNKIVFVVPKTTRQFPADTYLLKVSNKVGSVEVGEFTIYSGNPT